MDDRSLLDELMDYVPDKNRVNVIGSRASHILSSAINILDLIDTTFEPEVAEDLNKRFMLALRNRDMARFMRGLDKLGGDDDEQEK